MKISLKWLLILFALVSFACGKDVYAQQTAVELTVNPNDAFAQEKQEINRFLIENPFDFKEFRKKIDDLKKKEQDFYSEDYDDVILDRDYSRINQHFLINSILTENENVWRELIKQHASDHPEEIWNEITAQSFKTFETGCYDTALMIDKQILELCEQNLSKDHPWILKIKLYLARDYGALGDSQAAIKLTSELLTDVEKTFGKNSIEMLFAFRTLGKEYLMLEKYQESKDFLQKAANVSQKLYPESHPVTLTCLNDLVKVEIKRREYLKAVDILRKIEPQAEKLDESNYLSMAVKLEIHRSRDVFDRYMHEFKPSSPGGLRLNVLPEEISRLPGYFSVNPRATDTLEELVESERALSMPISLSHNLELVNFCYVIFGEDHHRTLNALSKLSEAYLSLGENAVALKIAQMSTEMSRNRYGEMHPATSHAVYALAKVYRKSGRYEDAKNLDQYLLELRSKYYGKDSLETYEATEALASDYKGLKSYAESARLYETALAGYRKLLSAFDPRAMRIISTLHNESEKLFESELAQNFKMPSIDDPRIIRTIAGLMESYNALGKHQNVVKLWDSVLPLLNAEYKNVDAIRTITYDVTRKMEAEIVADMFMNPADFAKVMQALAIAYQKSGDNKKAVLCYKKMLDTCELINYMHINNRSTYLWEELPTEAKIQWFSEIAPDYKAAIEFLSSQNETELTFYFTELCKCRGLEERYRAQLALHGGSLSEEHFENINRSVKLLTRYKKLMDDSIKNDDYFSYLTFDQARLATSRKYKYYQSMSRLNNQKYRRILTSQILVGFKPDDDSGQIHHADIKSRQQFLADNVCFVDFLMTPNAVLAFTLTKTDKLKAVNIPTDAEFLNNCNVYRELLSHPTIENMRADNKYLWKFSDGRYKIVYGRQSQENATLIKTTAEINEIRQTLSALLSETLLKPLENDLSQKSVWIISPDDRLNDIPFETLQYKGKSAIESADISYVPSLSILALMNNNALSKNPNFESRKNLFAMGDAIYNGSTLQDSRGSIIDFSELINRTLQENPSTSVTMDFSQLKWNNLPGTKKELDKISQIFSTDTAIILTGRDASESNLKSLNQNGTLSEYKYLLFAAHGLFVPKMPEFNSIVLSQGIDAEEDGYITVGEWMSFDLNSDLIYLSACESGLGDYQSGEGIVGIPYALTVAGNKDTVMSLWKVNDEATAEFTAAVFEKLSKGASEIKALNETKREFMSKDNSKFSDPSVWAAFVLYGI